MRDEWILKLIFYEKVCLRCLRMGIWPRSRCSRAEYSPRYSIWGSSRRFLLSSMWCWCWSVLSFGLIVHKYHYKQDEPPYWGLILCVDVTSRIRFNIFSIFSATNIVWWWVNNTRCITLFLKSFRWLRQCSWAHLHVPYQFRCWWQCTEVILPIVAIVP